MKKIKIIMIIIFVLIFVVFIGMLSINFKIISETKNQILSENELEEKQVDCILILGAGVWGDSPSPMLEDRLLEGIKLYNLGVSDKLLMSGDHSKDNYDEVNVMKDFAIEKGIDSKNIFMDHAGFSTYDSLYRAKEIFDVKKLIIVTQDYHLPRALYIANSMGLEAYGVKANPREYAGQMVRDLREIVARNKDFFSCIFKPLPKFLGEKIPISGDGDLTNDK